MVGSLRVDRASPSRIASPALLALTSNGIVETALGFSAMTVLNRHVPAITASLASSQCPSVGRSLSAVILGGGPDPLLVLSTLITLAGSARGAKARE